MRLVGALTLLATLVACHNPCQDLCKEIAQYAEDCGLTVPDGEPGACIDATRRSELEDGDTQTCRENADFLRTEWTCDDVALYFDGASGAETN